MTKIFNTIIIITFLTSCSKFQECNELETKIKNICTVQDSLYIIPLSTITDYEWDKLYVVEGPTIDNEVEELIGIKYNKVIQDHRREYLFIKNNRIIKEYSSYCNLNLSKKPSYTIGQIYTNKSIIQVSKQENEGHFIYKIVEVR